MKDGASVAGTHEAQARARRSPAPIGRRSLIASIAAAAVASTLSGCGLMAGIRDFLPWGRADRSAPAPRAGLADEALYPHLLLPEASFFTPAPATKPDKKVFAHYMVALPIFGGPGGGVDGLKQEILMAQSMGLDGFALNVGVWLSDTRYGTHYQDVVTNMFEAAQELGTGFALFFSMDMTGLDYPDIIDMMTRFARHPNHFVHDGRPVLSTYGGAKTDDDDDPDAAAWWRHRVVDPLKAKGIDVFFCPAFDRVLDAIEPEAAAGEVAHWGDLIQGMTNWRILEIINNDKDTTPARLAAAYNEAYAKALASESKLLMACVCNLYWGSRQPTAGRRYFEFEGGIGIDVQWRSIIEIADPPWVEILTWNDLNESYMMPIDDPIKYNPWGPPLGWYEDHRAYGELTRYYIQWFKTGAPPQIAKDALFYFYRTQPMAMKARNDPAGPVDWFLGPVADMIYVTTCLKDAAVLTVSSGSTRLSYNLLPGLQHTRVPFQPGVQAFSLSRHGATFASTGGRDIITSAELYDFWNTTGFVEV